MTPLTQQVLAGHLALCQGQRESVNQMAAAARKDVLETRDDGRSRLAENRGLPSNRPDLERHDSGYQAPPAATLHDSAQQSPALENISAQSCSPAPALLQLEATVMEVNRYAQLPHMMTLRFGRGEYVGQVRVQAPADAFVGQRWVLVGSPVQCGEQSWEASA